MVIAVGNPNLSDLSNPKLPYKADTHGPSIQMPILATTHPSPKIKHPNSFPQHPHPQALDPPFPQPEPRIVTRDAH